MLKLYTGDVVAATSSKGNQEKWFDKTGNRWYKLDTIGFEALAEAVAGQILKKSNVETEHGFKVIQYSIGKVTAHKKDRICCVSDNFLADDEELITMSQLLKKELGEDYQKKFQTKRTVGQRIQLLVDTVQKVTGLNRFGEYLTLLFECDALILNEDRHLNNIAVLHSPRGYDYCPLFDNGNSFLLDTVAYPLDVNTKALFKQTEAKPFHHSFTIQVSAAQRLYGPQLKISITEEELTGILEAALEHYPQMYRSYLKERILCVVMEQQK